MHIIGSGTIGGAENFVFQLARYQHEHAPDIDGSILFRKGRGFFVEKARENGLSVYTCQGKMGIRDLWTSIQLFRKFDILHFHGLYPALFLAAFLSGRTSLYFVHGARSLTKTLKTVLTDAAVKGELPTVMGFRRVIRRQWFKIFLKYIVKEVQVATEFYKNFYMKKYGIGLRRIRTLPLGIDFSTMNVSKPTDQVRRELGIKNGERIVGCVSTFRSLKRIDRLLEGYTRAFCGDGSMNKTRLLIVGDGFERKRIVRQIKEKNLEEKVILTGMRNDVPNLLSVMEVFVLPSEFENFPLSIVEAMYFKIPVIVFAGSGGAEEIVRSANAGLLVRDESELADAMRHLLDNVDQAKKLGAIGCDYVTRKFSMERFSQEIAKDYWAALRSGK